MARQKKDNAEKNSDSDTKKNAIIGKENASKNKNTNTKANRKDDNKIKSSKSKKAFYFSIIIIILIAALVIFTFLYILPLYVGTSLSTFKSNFNSGQRIAVVSQYTNSTQYNILSQCSTDIISAETASNGRNASTIDFYVINSTTCTYAPNGLGHVLNPVTTNASSCEKQITAEPSISLNYSQTNYTVISPYHLTIYGNSKYFLACPIAVGLIK